MGELPGCFRGGGEGGGAFWEVGEDAEEEGVGDGQEGAVALGGVVEEGCTQKINTRRETRNAQSRAGQRPIGAPDELLQLLRQHREEQARERVRARDLWTEKGYVFTSPTGEPLDPNTDYHKWKELLKAAGVRGARLHDARHTAATVLLILGVSDAVVDSIMGWEPGKSARMRRRYQHLTSRVLKDTAAKVGGLLWGTDETVGSAVPDASQSPVPAELVVHVARLGEWRVPFLHREHADEVVARWSEDWPDHTADVEEWDRWRWEHQDSGGASVIRDRVPERAVVFHARAVFLPGGGTRGDRIPRAVVAAGLGVRDRPLHRSRLGLAHGPPPRPGPGGRGPGARHRRGSRRGSLRRGLRTGCGSRPKTPGSTVTRTTGSKVPA